MFIGIDNMAGNRISLVEQYNNKDVISQIYGMKDELGGYTESIDSATKKAEEASSKADTAYEQAQEAETKADSVVEDVTKAQSDATEALTKAKTAQATADVSINDATIKTTSAGGNLYMNQNDGGQKASAIPIASGTTAGLMNAQTFNAVGQLESRVSTLEGRNTIVYVTFTSDSPTQSEITTAFATKASRQPVAGDMCSDIARSLTYQYDGTAWIATKQVAGKWSNTEAGIVLGTPETGEAGTIFAEADGTGSVNGWDELATKVSNNTNDITNLSSKVASNTSSIDSNTTNITKNTADIATLNDDVAGLDSSKQMKLKQATATLTTSGWVLGTTGYYYQSVDCSIVTSTNIVWVSPTTNVEEYGAKGVYASVQSTGALSFTAKKLPENSLTVAIVTAE